MPRFLRAFLAGTAVIAALAVVAAFVLGRPVAPTHPALAEARLTHEIRDPAAERRGLGVRDGARPQEQERGDQA